MKYRTIGEEVSAAEKLRVLDEAMTRAEKPWLATIDEIELSEKSISDLAAVLPQILAVVDAAERVNDPVLTPALLSSFDVLDSALAALDEALS